MDTTRYAVAVYIIAVLPPAVIYWFLVHSFVSFWRRMGPAKTHSTLGVLFAMVFLGLINFRDHLVLTDYGNHMSLMAIAAAFLTLAVWMWRHHRRHLTMRIMLGTAELEERGQGQQLLQAGIYGRIRNPRYVEMAVGTLACVTFSNYLGAYLAALAFFPALHFVVLLEERELHDRFGEEYEAYCNRVPRYIPRRS